MTILPLQTKSPSPSETKTARRAFTIGCFHLASVGALLHLGPLLEGPWLLSLSAAVLFSSIASLANGLLGKPNRIALHTVLPCAAILPRSLDKTWTWHPIKGWCLVDKSFRTELERQLSGPMVAIALLVLPIFAIEHYWQDAILAQRGLQSLLETSSALIWAAFTFEFLARISVAEKKMGYVKAHWLDLVIILLPLVAFLRLMRLGQLARLQKLQKTARVFRLKGLTTRLWRAVILFDVLGRLLRRSPEARLEWLNRQREDALENLRMIDESIAQVERSQSDAEPEIRAAA